MAITVHNHLLRTGADFNDLAAARKAGTFKGVAKAHKMGQQAVIDEVKKAVLLGRGGAGFPAGVKWGFLPPLGDKPRYLVVNADEGEPGTFKDRIFLRDDPFQLIEGCIITSMALDIHAVYIYVRGEFFREIENLERAIADCHKAGILGKKVMGIDYELEIYVHRGAGAYVCGEETALLESIEGKAGKPRLKPPFPAVVGLFGCPTIINNVESIANVARIIDLGAEAWNALGVPKDGGTRLMGISGHVKKPGVYEFGTGVCLDEIIYDVCGGILGDRELKAVIPGGVSCPVLTPDEIKGLKMTCADMMAAGTMLGTCGVIVIAEGTCLVKSLQRLSHFYAHESCGQCTPCREGCGWMARIVDNIEAGLAKSGDLDLLVSLADQIAGHTICALGDAAAFPVKSFVEKFRDEFQAHIDQGGCPFEGKPLPR